MLIDDYYTNSLVIVDFYPNSTGSLYNLYSFGYGSLATAIKVVPPLIPIYINVLYPTYTSKVFETSVYQWDFLNVATNTQYFSYREN